MNKMTKEDRTYFREFIRNTIHKEISRLTERATIKIETKKSEYLTIQQVIDLYGVSRPHIYNLRKDKKLSFHYLSERKPFIRQTEIELLFQKRGAKNL